jgi:hypothetical protein
MVSHRSRVSAIHETIEGVTHIFLDREIYQKIQIIDILSIFISTYRD